MIKCIIFDFDGTLVDSNKIKKQTFYDVTSHIPHSREILEEIFSNPDIGDRYEVFSHFSRVVQKNYGFLAEEIELSNDYSSLCEERVSKASETKEAKKTLSKLSKMGIRLFVSSATPEKALKNIIVKRGLNTLFERIYGSPKSKEEHIKSVMSVFEYKPTEIIYVGDSEDDQRAASSVNCHFFAVGSDYTRFVKKPRALNEALTNLPEFVGKTFNND